MSAKAYKLFSDGKRLVQVAIILNLREPELTKLHKEYCKLTGRDTLNLIHKETNDNTWPIWKLYQQLVKNKGMSIEQVVNAIDIAIHKLPYMESLYEQAKYEVEKMQHTIQRLANDIRALGYKISILDKIALSSEQEYKRTEQQLQELTTQKDILEKLIANILNGEDYTKLKHIVKENVKVVLSENKKLVSISFVALIQNMPSVNDGEQHKDDNNNIRKYLESNKDKILDLDEKNYENLVEVLTNNAIDTAASAASSSNDTLSLPQPS